MINSRIVFLFMLLCWLTPLIPLAADRSGLTVINLDSEGRPFEVKFRDIPAKVITTNGPNTELMLRLGLEKHLIGTAYLDNSVAPDLREAYERLPVIAEKYPGKELVLSLAPDFIYGWASVFKPQFLGEVGYWNDLGIRTFVTRNSVKPQAIDNFYQDIMDIGRIFQVEDRAADIVSQARRELEEISRKAATRPRQEGVVFGEYLPNGIFLAYGHKSLAGEMLALAGGVGRFPGGGILSAEDLVAANPEVFILIHMLKDGRSVSAHLDEIRKHPILSKLPAVKNKRVYPLPLADVHCGGVRIPGGVRRLAAFLHPEIFDAPEF